MGQRGELFSTRVILQNRTYFFNVKENRMGDLYLNIVESKNRDEGGFDRQSVILFADDLQQFLKGFDESLRILEREVRERRRSAHTVASDTRGGARSDAGSVRLESGTFSMRNERRSNSTGFKPKSGKNIREDKKPNRSDKPRREGPPQKGKRVVVKKH